MAGSLPCRCRSEYSGGHLGLGMERHGDAGAALRRWRRDLRPAFPARAGGCWRHSCGLAPRDADRAGRRHSAGGAGGGIPGVGGAGLSSADPCRSGDTDILLPGNQRAGRGTFLARYGAGYGCARAKTHAAPAPRSGAAGMGAHDSRFRRVPPARQVELALDCRRHFRWGNLRRALPVATRRTPQTLSPGGDHRPWVRHRWLSELGRCLPLPAPTAPLSVRDARGSDGEYGEYGAGSFARWPPSRRRAGRRSPGRSSALQWRTCQWPERRPARSRTR